MTYTLLTHRFRLFREHKYVFYVFSTVLQKLATANVADHSALKECRDEIHGLMMLHKGHAAHEDSGVARLLREKGSKVFHEASELHQTHEAEFEAILEMIDNILHTHTEGSSILDQKSSTHPAFESAYHLYLRLRHLFAETLLHLDYEETVVMPELQRLCSDEELKAIDHESYDHMSSHDLVNMMQVLSPHFNAQDRSVFCRDIYEVQPEKFLKAWPDIKPLLSETEIKELVSECPGLTN